ncbi:hypothetical protein GCM10009677_10920 [Sphaerisporangium rubeum]
MRTGPVPAGGAPRAFRRLSAPITFKAARASTLRPFHDTLESPLVMDISLCPATAGHAAGKAFDAIRSDAGSP